MGSLTDGGSSTRIGAPRETWRALAPIILARSNLVSFGGPIRISWVKSISTQNWGLGPYMGGMPPGIPPMPPGGIPPGPPAGGFIFEAAMMSSIFSSIVEASVADLTAWDFTCVGS